MLTIIMPFYKKDIEFNFVFENYNLPVFNKINMLEILIVMDDPRGYESIIQHLSFLVGSNIVNFKLKIILNEKMHDWRPPCKAINVGIRHATYSKILVVSPETIFIPGSLENLISASSEEYYSIGLIKFVNLSSPIYHHVDKLLSTSYLGGFTPYGSILFTKKQADKIGGYNEKFINWGGDDDDFRARLKKAGFQQKITLAKFLHVNLKRNNINGCISKRDELNEKIIKKKIKSISEEKSYVANNGLYGYDFEKVIYENITK